MSGRNSAFIGADLVEERTHCFSDDVFSGPNTIPFEEPNLIKADWRSLERVVPRGSGAQ